MHEPSAVIAGQSLERMREGVTEIEQGAVALFCLVADYHGGLGVAADGNGMSPAGAAGEHIAVMILQPCEKGRIVDQPVFDDLGIARAKLARR